MSAGRESNCEQLRAVPLLCAWSRNRCCQCIVEGHTGSHDSGPRFGLLNGFRWQHGAVHVTGVSLAGWWQVLFTWSKLSRQCVDRDQSRDSRNEMCELYDLTWRPGKTCFFNSKSVWMLSSLTPWSMKTVHSFIVGKPKSQKPSHLSRVTIHQPVWDTSFLLNLLLFISFKSPLKI